VIYNSKKEFLFEQIKSILGRNNPTMWADRWPGVSEGRRSRTGDWSEHGGVLWRLSIPYYDIL